MEDFGIVGVEALAAGTPLIAYNQGGSQDFVTPKTGVFFNKQDVKSLVAAIDSFNPNRYNPDEITQFAQQFSTETFVSTMRAVVDAAVKEKSQL
jgi:glycosyltransferase involved in cell wall biosynthesis